MRQDRVINRFACEDQAQHFSIRRWSVWQQLQLSAIDERGFVVEGNSNMRYMYLTCAIALKLLSGTTPTQADEVKWGVVNVETTEGKRISYYATNGKTAPVVTDAGVGMTDGGNFRIGCFDELRYIYLKTGKLGQAAGSISENGIADIELYNGKPQIPLKGRLIQSKDRDDVSLLAKDVDKGQFVLIANRLMSGTDKLGFRIRAGSPDDADFAFQGEIGVGLTAPAAVADALRNCGFR
jgi:hypothetical protein